MQGTPCPPSRPGGAIQKVHAEHGLVSPPPKTGYEFIAALTAATATLAVAGPGKLALN